MSSGVLMRYLSTLMSAVCDALVGCAAHWLSRDTACAISYLVVKVDNRQSKTFQEGTCLRSKLRGVVDMRAAWVQELRDLATVSVKWIPAHKNKADILTKCFPNWVYQDRKKLITG